MLLGGLAPASSSTSLPLLSGDVSTHAALCTSLVSASTATPLVSLLPLAPVSVPSSTGAAAKDFSLSRAAIPVPAKLVGKIQALKFIDMRELLADNIKMMAHLESLPAGSQAIQASSSHQREVPNIQSWVCAFCSYIAIVAEVHPHRVRDLLAYMQNLMRDATRYRGDGWCTYDYVFRSQAAADPLRNWAEPDTSLVLAYMARSGTGLPNLCGHCFDVDHSSQSCALAPFNTPLSVPASSTSPRPHANPAHSPQNICISWNLGACAMPGTCRYRHVCATLLAVERGTWPRTAS